MVNTEAPMRPQSVVWLEGLAHLIGQGKPIHPCPKALRRVAKELETALATPSPTRMAELVAAAREVDETLSRCRPGWLCGHALHRALAPFAQEQSDG